MSNIKFQIGDVVSDGSYTGIICFGNLVQGIDREAVLATDLQSDEYAILDAADVRVLGNIFQRPQVDFSDFPTIREFAPGEGSVIRLGPAQYKTP